MKNRVVRVCLVIFICAAMLTVSGCKQIDSQETTTAGNSNIQTTKAETDNYVVETDDENLNIQSDLKETHSIIGNIPNGTPINVSKITDDWGYTEYEGKNGWVSMKALRPFSDKVTDNDLETMSKFFVGPLWGCFGGWSGGYLGYDQIDWENLTPNLAADIVFSLQCSGHATSFEPMISYEVDTKKYEVLYDMAKYKVGDEIRGPTFYCGYSLSEINNKIKVIYGEHSRPLTGADFSQFSSDWQYETGSNANSSIYVAYSQDYQSVLVFVDVVTGWETFTPTYLTEIKAEGDTVSLFNRTYSYDYNSENFESYYDSTFSKKEVFARQKYFEGKENDSVKVENESEYVFTLNTDGSFSLKSVNIINSNGWQ